MDNIKDLRLLPRLHYFEEERREKCQLKQQLARFTHQLYIEVNANYTLNANFTLVFLVS